VVVYGLADRYTDYVYNEKNASLVGTKNHDQLESIRNQIIAGEIVVDDTAVGQ
jgi:basic membrane protein A